MLDDAGADRDLEVAERQELARIAWRVTARVPQWHDDGLRVEALLAMLHHCAPLTDEDALDDLPPVAYRTHAYALAALLLLHRDRHSGDLATELVEMLDG